jgi:formylglycine-generating enzyme required for sulfatase activity
VSCKPPIPEDNPYSLAVSIVERAFTGVSSSVDWEPVILTIGGVEMALVPAGCFEMGSTDEQIDYVVSLGAYRTDLADEQPAHEVCFEVPFWIDVYEVTNQQFGSLGCSYWSWRPSQPRNCIEWTDSLAHCKARGARLPTEAEWEYAARGPNGLLYPWGNEFIADNVVYTFNSGQIVWDVGSKPDGVSWIGAYDLSGNMWEWVSDWYGAYSSDRQVNPQGPSSGEYRVLRGGSWNDGSIGARSTYRFGSNFSDLRTGFRCALSFTP